MFLIKQVSSDLGITPQAIYKQKEELQSKGYMIKNSSNDWEITSDGYNYLKEKKSIIVNLEYVNKDVARRIVDFISGGVHALDGHIQKVSNAIFLVAPVNYEIASDLAREEIKNKLSVSWLKNNN